jgi:hypothetical protein
LAFSDETFERGHAASFAAIFKGNQFAILALAKVGNLARLHQGIPLLLAEVALLINEQFCQVTDGQLICFWIDRQGFATTFSATGSQSHCPSKTL